MALMWFLVNNQVFAQSIFDGTGTGPIPDANPSGLNITFAVTGISKPIKSVAIELTMNHSFVGDLTGRLSAPGNIAQIGIFGRTGYRRSGNTSPNTDLNGVYTFTDDAVSDWWQATANGGSIPTGSYRSSTLTIADGGNTAFSSHGGCTTRIDGAFVDLLPGQSNGNWVFNITDLAGSDLGTVTAARLIIEEKISLPDLIFSSGFEAGEQAYAEFATLLASNLLGSCEKSRFDFTGTGLASYALVADDLAGGLDWTIQDNDRTTAGAIQTFKFGLSNGSAMEGDIDGDGIKDPIVWVSGAAGEAAYYVRRSSRPDDRVLKFIMGQTGDAPAQLGDYDGDGIEDFALFRAPSVSGTTQLIIHESSTKSFRTINMLAGTPFTVFPTGGFDYTGDGVADIALQTTSTTTPGAGMHTIYNGVTGSVFDAFEFGNNTDLLAPGNYLGDARADINLGRNQGGVRAWYSKQSGPGTEVGPTFWGDGIDFMLSGDYDGDGLDDYAVWKSADGRFVIRPSNTPASTLEVNLGQSGNYPVANSRVQ